MFFVVNLFLLLLLLLLIHANTNTLLCLRTHLLWNCCCSINQWWERRSKKKINNVAGKQLRRKMNATNKWVSEQPASRSARQDFVFFFFWFEKKEKNLNGKKHRNNHQWLDASLPQCLTDNFSTISTIYVTSHTHRIYLTLSVCLSVSLLFHYF